MIPRRSIDALRKQADIAIDLFGMETTLFILINSEDVEGLDIYARPTDMEYEKYTTKVFIKWNPSMYRLKKLGLYVEDELAILVKLPRQATNVRTQELVNVDIITGSYFRVPIEYVPSNFNKYSEFELVDMAVGKMHDAAIYGYWKAVPRRKVEPDIREHT
jgi:hypothetical protein